MLTRCFVVVVAWIDGGNGWNSWNFCGLRVCNGKYDLNDGGWPHPYPRRPYEVRHSLLVEVGSESGGVIHPGR